MGNLTTLTQKGAENLERSLESLKEKDLIITRMQDAVTKRDSVTLALVQSFKSSLGTLSDDDIEINGDIIDSIVVGLKVADDGFCSYRSQLYSNAPYDEKGYCEGTEQCSVSDNTLEYDINSDLSEQVTCETFTSGNWFEGECHHTQQSCLDESKEWVDGECRYVNETQCLDSNGEWIFGIWHEPEFTKKNFTSVYFSMAFFISTPRV